MKDASPEMMSIFAGAIERPSSEERAAFLDTACGSNVELRGRIEALLRAHDAAGGFLRDRPTACEPAATINQPAGEGPGSVIGPYKLLEQIGEGGFGVVYMAEQTQPVRRKVALKVLKPGMDTRQVVARFEAERQALAIMDHPNIAKVFDGGVTPSGRPYFVMELVKGIPITDFCDEHQLTPRQRLELFVPVCQAVQHAHQKGIIHRDLKPSNVLVSQHDTTPVVKVIDFGVAKALGQELTDKTLFTGLAQMVGTPLYMSPEQAGQSGLDVDTRSDIYSLGVLLYELLTGTTPFAKERFKQAAYDEIRRIIREEEPPKPSTRLSDSKDSLPSVAAQRHTEPAKLTKLVRGELDWIVMKALEKDRNRRYETANGFAQDVQRYLADEPVLACPPSVGYRLRKFARRNKGGLAVAALVLFFLVLVGSGVGWAVRDWSARQAEAARQQAERQGKVAGQVEPLLAEVGRLEKEQKWPEALAAARRAEAAVAGGEADADTAERVRSRLKDLAFIDRMEQIRMQRATGDDAGGARDAVRNYARAFHDYGVDVEVLAVETSIDRLKARPALAMPLAAALDDWAHTQREVSTDDAGRKRLVAIARGIDPEPLRDLLRAFWVRPLSETEDELRRLTKTINVRAHHPATLHLLGLALSQDRGLRMRILREAQAAYPGDFWFNFELGWELYYPERRGRKKDLDGAIRFFSAAVAARPSATFVYSHLAMCLRRQGKRDEAIAVLRTAVERNPKYFDVCKALADALVARGKPDEAVAVFRKAIEARPEDAGTVWRAIGDILRGQKKPDEADAAYREAIAAYRKAIEARPEGAGNTWRTIGDILRDQKKPDEAGDAYREAIATYRQAVESAPDLAAAGGHIRSIGEILTAQGKPVEAIAIYRQAIAAGSKYAHKYWQAIAGVLVGQRKPDEAIAAYREAIEAKREDAGHNWQAIGDILRRQKRPNEAADAYRAAIKLKPDDPLLHRYFGLTLRDQNKLSEANAAFDRAIELYRIGPDLPSARRYSYIADVLREKGDLDGAIAAYRQAIETGPEDAGYYWQVIAAVRRDQKKPDDAIAAYRKAAEADPQNPELHCDLGDALAQRGALDEAIGSYRKALTLDPISNLAAAANFKIGNALYRQKKMPEAIAAYSTALDLDRKKMTGAYYMIGKILRDWGNLDEAIAWYNRAIESNPPNAIPGLHTDIGEVLLQQNKFEEAAAAFRKAIEIEKNSPRSHQNLAWILASRPEANLRDPAQAVLLAKRAVQIAKSEMAWQYLGWVHYRAGDWKASVEALEKSCKLQKGGTGDAGQWIVMALAHARLAAQDGLPEKERELHKTEARRWFEKADKLIDRSWRVRPADIVGPAIWDFREEARELLGPKEGKK